MASTNVSHEYNIRSTQDLTEKEVNALRAMGENYKEGELLKIYTFPNFSTDGEDVPRGTVFVHPKTAPVHPDSIPEQMFVVRGIAKIEPRKNAPNGYTTQDFQGESVKEAFSNAIPQFTHYNGPTLYPDSQYVNKESGLVRWAPELGEEGSSVGIMETTGARGRGKEYYLVAQAGAHQACRDLKEHIKSQEKPMTFGELVRDPMFQNSRNLARSNCLRLMRNAAASIGVPITRIYDRMVDSSPERAEPEYEQSVSTIKKISHNGQECVAVFHGVVPMDEVNAASDGNFFIQAHPYEGIYIYPMHGNARGVGLPAETGKLPTDKASVPGEQEGFVWERQQDLENHPELYEDVHRSIDDAVEDALVEAGYNRRNRRKHLVPILMKLCNPELKRSE